MLNPDLQRVVVVGTSCSGKTALAGRVAGILGVPHIELDAIHWLPKWRERPTEEFRELTARAVAADLWVVDGNYSKVRDIVWARATCVIWLNYSFPMVIWRALSRTITRSVGGQVLFSGNKESLRMAFLSKESIIWWVISTYRRRRREYPVLFQKQEFRHLNIIEFRKQREADAFLRSIGDGRDTGEGTETERAAGNKGLS